MCVAERQYCDTPCSGSRHVVDCATYNTLIVGGANHCDTSTRSDDQIACFSDDINPATSQEFPHLVAPAQTIEADGYPSQTGTSFAAPLVAGGAAQLIQVNGNLSNWPEALRSLLMVGANETVSGGPLDLGDGVDDRDGAGELNVAVSTYVANSARKVDGGNAAADAGHDYGTMYSMPSGNWYGEVYHAKTSSPNRRLRVVLSWDGTATCTTPTTTAASCSAPTLDADLDLYVYKVGSGTPIAYSVTGVNSYEFIEFAADVDQGYEIKIKGFSWNASYTYFGVAWRFYDYTTS